MKSHTELSVGYIRRYGGNRSQWTKPSNMPRPSRKRGKEVEKRGISKEQVCVATALDRQGII